MDKLEQQQYWARQMAVAPAEAPPEAEPEPQLPPSVRERNQWGEHVPGIEELRSRGQFTPDPVVAAAPNRQADTRTTNGTPATPRSHPSPWRAYEYGPYDD
jgi:hypothetical protein